MKLRLITAIFLISCLTGVLPAADPELLGLVMPNAKVIGGVNVEQATATPFGQFLLSQFPGTDQGFQKFVTMTGFDPRRDVRDVLMASTGGPSQGRPGLLLVRGNFDVPKILELVRSKGQTPILYQGVEILSDTHNTKSLAFLSDSIAVAGSATEVRAAIDRRSSPTSLDPDLALQVNRWSTTQDAWAVALGPLPSPPPGETNKGPFQANVIGKVQEAGGGVKFGSTVQFSAEAVAMTEQDANSLADVVRLIVSMAQLHTPPEKAAEMTALLQNFSVKTAANKLQVSLAVPEAQLEQWIKSAHHHPRARRTAAPVK